MPVIHRTANVAYSATEIYQLVDQVSQYAEFIPWCTRSHELSRTATEVHATLELSGGGFHKSFTTCNILHPFERIEINLVNGPFKHLEGFWRFVSLPDDRCLITLDLEFEFAHKLLGLAFGPVFQQAANMLVDAFTKRAQQIYGHRDESIATH